MAEAAIDLVARGDFAAAISILRCHVAELEKARGTKTVYDFLNWYDLPAETRPPFWDWIAERRAKEAVA
ncbi:hypothetical protein [Amaricoccus solimangrovi]|uniref:Uncharacterized protein n=1 Tax=Amaricoccus solimangrovi TaxID=2589815 RepID=A0A501WJ92_9RHOB|nr:hypothetical protein [Amaricoccus solimangrovi]TPE49953.1 hypothetical protein FJM51_13445 [Amaricoccus solimangrovi]